LWAIMAVVAALGTETLVTKEIAQAPGRLNELTSTALALRALVFIFGALGMVAFVQLAGYPAQTVNVIWIVGISFLVSQLSLTFDGALRGLERMEYTSLSAVVSRSILSFLCIGLLLLGFAALYLTSRDWLKGLSLLVSVFMIFEAVFHRRIQALIVQATLVLTVLATLILIYAFFWEIVILSVVGIGLLIIVDNLRELRGSGRR